MDHPHSTTLMDAVGQVPDPRKPRGKRHPWPVLLTIICSALVSEQRTPHAIAHWATLHATELLAHLQPTRRCIPSESTLRRALRTLDLPALERQLTQFIQALEADPPPPAPAPPLSAPTPHLQGQAVDGKALRGARKHGQRLHLVSLVRHGRGLVLAQTAVVAKSNEITAVPTLLAGRDLSGTITTLDALLTQTTLAQQILDQHGHYLMVVKQNQPQLYADLELLFATPPLPADAAAYSTHQTISKGHGRLETRTLTCSTELCGYLTWPGVGQVLRRVCERRILKTGRTSVEVSYGISSVRPEEAGAAELEAHWRGHWTIENRVHYVRDVTLGEDQGQGHTGNTAHALAALRNGVVSLFRWKGWANIADALRTYGASVPAALELIGATPARL